MAGRNAKPIALHLAEGNPNRLTKAEIKARQEAEVKLGADDFKKIKKPSFVSKDKVANKKWNDLIKEYKSAAEQGVELLTSSDVGLLARYCKTFSEYENLLEARQKVENVEIDQFELEEFIDAGELAYDTNLKALRYLSQLASIDGILKIENAINKKMDQLVKMEDRLFLNPLAKVKNVPRRPEPKKESAMAKFMNRRGAHGS